MERLWRFRGVALVAVLCCSALAVTAVALARSTGADSGTSVSFHAPAEAVVGARVVARGRVAGLDGRGSLRAQSLAGGSWRTLARQAAGNGRFQIPLRLPGAGRAAKLRVVLMLGGRRVATSATTRVLLKRAFRGGSDARTAVPFAAAASAAPSTQPPAGPVVPPGPEPPIKPSSSLHWGGWIDPGTPEQPAPINPTAIAKFEAIAEKRPSVLESFSAFAVCGGGNCSSFYAFPQAQLEAIRQRGAIPLFSWASESSSGEVSQPDFELSDIAAGRWDGYIRQWATAARAWGHPFLLRFDWEMNGNWFPWGQGVNGNEAGEYVAAWRHVHDIFTEVGATNATWTWCPFVGPRPVAGFYPGDEYVDWTCLDGYNNTKTTAWRSFKQIFTPAYEEVTETIAPSKPMLIAETASSEEGAPSGTSKAEWITQMLQGVPTEFPAVRGLLWFNYEEGGKGWPLATSAATEDAFSAGIADPIYLPGSASGPFPLP